MPIPLFMDALPMGLHCPVMPVESKCDANTFGGFVMKQRRKSEPVEQLRRSEKKWTMPLIKSGFTILPNVIIERQKALGLSPTELNVLLHLVTRWWYADNPPYPSKKTIADAMQVHPSTVQRAVRRLESAGYVKREERFDRDRGQLSNIYRLDGLIESSLPLAEEAIEEREEIVKRNRERRERKSRRRSSSTKLTLVKNDNDEGQS